jgi:hypothetical protein
LEKLGRQKGFKERNHRSGSTDTWWGWGHHSCGGRVYNRVAEVVGTRAFGDQHGFVVTFGVVLVEGGGASFGAETVNNLSDVVGGRFLVKIPGVVCFETFPVNTKL